MLKIFVSLISILLIPQFAFSSCDTVNIPGHFVDRFEDNQNGTITDKMTNLIWMKCDININWDDENKTCQLPLPIPPNEFPEYVTYTWQEALKSASNIHFNGFTDWRLPNVKELGSLLEYGCAEDDGFSINRQYFTMTVREYWTSTPYSESMYDNNTYINTAWNILFTSTGGAGGARYGAINSSMGVRLVRNNI